MNEKINALYIHIPFCNKVCTYCDFYKMVAKDSLKEKYIIYLLKELQLKKMYLQNINTIYIGGGTPSSLPLNLLDLFLKSLSKDIDLSKISEFSIELNPLDVTEELCILLKKYYINRISLGIQSFNNHKLRFLGRDHHKKDAILAVKLLQKHGFTNINIDLIYAIPKDNFIKIKKDLKIATKLNISHLSTYSLIVEEKTMLYNLYQKSIYKPIPEEKEYNIYMKIIAFLKKQGFVHYEISNFAKPNYMCQHNLLYWTNKKYLGIGAGASYYIDNVRYTNIKNLQKYFAGIDAFNLSFQEKSILSIKEQMQEEIILGLRLVKGVNCRNFVEKYNISIEEAFPVVNKLFNNNLIVKSGDYLYIPEAKLYLSNTIMSEFL